MAINFFSLSCSLVCTSCSFSCNVVVGEATTCEKPNQMKPKESQNLPRVAAQRLHPYLFLALFLPLFNLPLKHLQRLRGGNNGDGEGMTMTQKGRSTSRATTTVQQKAQGVPAADRPAAAATHRAAAAAALASRGGACRNNLLQLDRGESVGQQCSRGGSRPPLGLLPLPSRPACAPPPPAPKVFW